MDPLSRRALLRAGGVWGASALLGAPLGPLLLSSPARAREGTRPRDKALIVLWLDGGPSQLETFDPHPGGPTGGPTRAIATPLPGVELAATLPRLAERADRLAVVRSLVTQEGEHQRGRALLRTGYPLTPTVEYPALTAVVAHRLPAADALEIPAHVALLARRPPRGGYLGAQWHAFAAGDPAGPLPDLRHPGGGERLERRLQDLALLEEEFARGREAQVGATQHAALARRAHRMMTSSQVAAFDPREEPEVVRARYGATPFGRGCLVARRLVERGVRAVEVTLGGWDTHVDNFTQHARLASVLDQAFAALVDDLAERDLLERTVVVCLGEFGRTPRINGLEGRDHWTRGFSAVLAGGGVRPGVVIGATDPRGERPPSDPVSPQDLHATIYALLGIDRGQWFDTPQGRPIRLNEGQPLAALLRA